MAKRDDIVNFLNKELNVKKIKDSSKNGLQLKGNSEVKKIAFAVDACLEVFEIAKKQGCNMVIVHHGMKWKPQKLENLTKKREQYLKQNKLSLYGAHLPLDMHNKYGNNIELARILNLKNIKKFGEYHGISIGFQGTFKTLKTLNEISKTLDNSLSTKSKSYHFGNQKIKTIAIVSGGGASALPEAITKKIDCFLTGEEHHSSYQYAKESRINLIFAGHYATETVGVKALMPLLSKKFNVETVFIDVPTSM